MNNNMNNLEEERKSNYSDKSMKASWDSLKRLRALSSSMNYNHQMKGNNYGPNLSVSMPNFNLKDDIANNKSVNSFNGHNTNNTCIDFDYSNLNSEELKQQIENIKKLYENKVIEIDSVYKNVNDRDRKINELTILLTNGLEDKNIDIQTNTQKIKEISDIKSEINNLRRRHNKKLQDIESESGVNLEKNIVKIHDEYNMRIKEFTETYDKNIKNLQVEILNLKTNISDLDSGDKYITKEEHEKTMNQLRNEQQEDLNDLEKEVEKYEALLREAIIVKGEETNQDVFRLGDIQKELNNGNENNDLICIISQLDTPLYTNVSKRNQVNSTISNYMSCKENIEELEEEDEWESVCEEVPINKINNLKQSQFFSKKSK